MDETAVSVRGGRHYLFRAVDKNGKSIGSLLCNDRNKESAQAFFRAAVADGRVPWPKKINIDGNKRPFEVWSRLVRKIPAGGKWKCVRGDISTTWLSKTIGLSNSGALRCWDSRPFILRQLLSRESNWRIALEKDSISYRSSLRGGAPR